MKQVWENTSLTQRLAFLPYDRKRYKSYEREFGRYYNVAMYWTCNVTCNEKYEVTYDVTYYDPTYYDVT